MLWLALTHIAAAWTLGEPHDLDRATAIDDALFDWALERGTLFPILDERGLPAGFVLVGQTELDLHLPSGSARATANRLVGLLDTPVPEARALVDGAPMALQVDGAVVLGVDAWDQVSGSLRQIHGSDVLYTLDEDGLENVLVMARRDVDRAKRLAATWLAQRERWWDEHLVEPAGLVTADGWGTAAPRWIASLHTDVDWSRFVGESGPADQPWLEVLIDPSGVVSPGDRALVWAFGQADEGRLVAADPFPRGAAPVRLDLVGSGATARFDASPAHVAVELGAVVDLAVVAVGGRVTHAVVDLPHQEQHAWRSMPPLPHGFELIGVHGPDGIETEVVPVSIGQQDEDRGEWRSFAIRLPVALEDGESTVLRIRYRDRHRFAHVLETQLGGYDYGATTDLLRVLPMLRGSAVRAAPTQVQLGVATSLPETVMGVASGHPVERWESESGRWVRVEGTHASMRVAAGRWPAHADDGGDAPRIEVHSLHGNRDHDHLPRVVTQVLDLYGPLLPPFPHDTLTVIEGPGLVYDVDVDSAPGLLWHCEVQDGAEVLSSLDAARTAEALVAQWFSDLEVPARDEGLPAAVAQVYALEGTRTFDGDVSAREAWEPHRTFQTDSPTLAWTLGPTLQARTGTPATLFEAVDRVLHGDHPPSRGGLADALEATTGEDWGDFFLVWQDTGLAPTLTVEWTDAGSTVLGQVTSDLPFGRVDVPLRIGHGKRALDVVVPVVDGRGRFDVDWDRAASIRVDPDDQLPLRGARVQRTTGR